LPAYKPAPPAPSWRMSRLASWWRSALRRKSTASASTAKALALVGAAGDSI
jgi:hypothetical protein